MTRAPSPKRAARLAFPAVLGAMLLSLSSAASPQAPAGGSAPPPVDSTAPAYRLGTAFLELLSGPGGEADASFVRDHLGEEWLREMDADSTAKWFGLMRRQSGGVTVERAETMGSMAVFHATTRNGGRRARLIFGGHDRDSSRLAFIAVVPDVRQYAGEPPALPDRRMPADSVMLPVERLLEWAAAHDLFTGTALVKRGDRIVLDHAYGLANRATGRVNSLPMRYHTGSWGKMMVAVAIGQLVDRGKLRFEDTLARVLPEYPNREVAKRITVHHLLTHTSGLGGLFDRRGWTRARPFVRQADLFPLFAAEPLGFEPGTETGYSNEAFVVLGAIVEQLSGRRLAEYLDRNVWRPAKMEETCDCLPLRGMDLRAIGYASFEDRDPFGLEPLSDNEHFLGNSVANGAGGWYSTPRDFSRFIDALRAGKLVKPGTFTRLVTPVSALMGSEPDYGYGFQVQSFGGKPTIGHGGGGQRVGIGVDSRSFTDGSWTVALFSNLDQPPVSRLERQILEYLARQ